MIARIKSIHGPAFDLKRCDAVFEQLVSAYAPGFAMDKQARSSEHVCTAVANLWTLYNLR
jgi:hypothetical protein